ncbi:hypothetical protein NW752_011963 [Fusarium irregulare]|uniref:Uncharacterized protein n=1 Tax=Fusarium irregulare TaxID=2494466 RepID=A0A9W8U5X4_9HYPO|nr:hypothetical protein NW752_011963 [Fusarium irregulare]KAJ4006434.1 hypothetical protein NW766_010521 [Fusarium irregulare]
MTKSQITTSTDIRKTIEATVNSFLSSYEDGREQGNTSLINRDVTADCTRQLLPVSLCKALGAPETFLMPNDLYEQLYIDDLTIGGVYNTVNKHVAIDTEARMAAVNSTSDFKFKDGEVLTMEFSWTFYLNEDGTKISKVIEFADASAVQHLAAKAQELKARQGTNDGAKMNQEVDFSETG